MRVLSLDSLPAHVTFMPHKYFLRQIRLLLHVLQSVHFQIKKTKKKTVSYLLRISVLSNNNVFHLFDMAEDCSGHT